MSEIETSTVMDRLTIFTEYFVVEFEKILAWTCDFLDGKITTEIPSNIATDIFCVGKEGLAVLGSPVSKPAKTVADMLSKKFFKYVEHQKNKKTITGLLKLIQDFKKKENQAGIRKILVESAVEIFYSYEMPFMFVTNDFGGYTRALLKLAKDTVRIILHYYSQEQVEDSLTVELVTNSLLHDAKYSLINNFVSNVEKPQHTIKILKNNKDIKIKTFKLFYKIGIVEHVGQNLKFYHTDYSKTDKYAYRRRFTSTFRESEPFAQYVSEENMFCDYNFVLRFENLLETTQKILEHINKNDVRLTELRTKETIEENTLKTIDQVKSTGEEIKQLVDNKTNLIIEKIETIKVVSDKVQEIEQSVDDLKIVVQTSDDTMKDQLLDEIKTSVEEKGDRVLVQLKSEVSTDVERLEKTVVVLKEELKESQDKLTEVVEVRIPQCDPKYKIKREINRIGDQISSEADRTGRRVEKEFKRIFKW